MNDLRARVDDAGVRIIEVYQHDVNQNEHERDKYIAALSEIIERFENKQSLHKDDCFAYQTAKKALAST